MRCEVHRSQLQNISILNHPNALAQVTQNEEPDDLDEDEPMKDSDHQAQGKQGEDSEAESKNAMTEEDTRTQFNKFIIESRCCMQ